ncbi:MAG: DUF2865 domain-containing protein [Candidatus Afipia apatlaquensis]|uniref:DUF2865 domain-containing protein n=1 Tax=Candidatus Afipia apatlaquensis TaxID=2712852 RepID=A0A7C9RH78_9BRAD|nr:DUF2865 domain-containing protein [Candidatus Afipia apatlaquensis]
MMRQGKLYYRSMAAAVAIGVVAVSFSASTAHARDFFSAFFGGVMNDNAQPSPQPSMPFASPFGDAQPSRRVNIYGGSYSGGSTTYCVRTCDGRYFPVAASDGQTKAEACKSFCPATETKIFHGGSIDNASSDTGRSYSDLPNAFRYRKELVPGCTCNGKDSVGLAPIKIEDDPTLRKGDIVAGADGLMVANSSRRSAALNFTPAPKSVRAKFERLPVVAAQ